ncbi:hypothetical protein Tco_1104556 [Tanacetum coccineum]
MDENVSDDSDKVDEQEETNTGTETPLNPVPVAMKTPNSYEIEYGLWAEDKLEKDSGKKISLPAEVYQLTKFYNVQRVDMVLNPPWNLPFLGAKGLTSPEQTATGVNTPGSDENRLKLYDLMYKIVKVADARVKDYHSASLPTDDSNATNSDAIVEPVMMFAYWKPMKWHLPQVGTAHPPMRN